MSPIQMCELTEVIFQGDLSNNMLLTSFKTKNMSYY